MSQGRHRYYRLAGPHVATALEALAHLGPPAPVGTLRQSNTAQALAFARTCYDHLAGRLGVAVHDAFTERGWLDASGTALAATGRRGLTTLGVDVEGVEARKRPTLLVCVDWTERRPHLAGGVGAALADLALERAWVRRVARSRALRITPEGHRGFADELGSASRRRVLGRLRAHRGDPGRGAVAQSVRAEDS